MSRQALVGLFVVVGAVALFAIFYFLGDFWTRSRGYKIGAHFQNASGLHRAAIVSMSGVNIGAVDDVQLEPDYSVDVILAIKPGFEIPKDSKFLILAPLTGEPSVVIEPPRGVQLATLPHEILPLDEQPQGRNPTSIQDLLEQGQGEIRRFDRIMADLERRAPHLLSELDSAMQNANQLTTRARVSLAEFSNSANSMMATLNRSTALSGENIVDLTKSLDATVKRNSRQIDGIIAQLGQTSHSVNQSAASLRDFATNPKIKEDLLETTHQFALTAKTFAELSNDMRQVSGNPQTQAQLRDTVAHFDATAQRIDSILGSLGGKSSVYGVDKGATPAPGGVTAPPPGYVPTSKPALPGSAPSAGPGVPVPSGATSPSPRSASPSAEASISPAGIEALKKRLNAFTKDLVELQVRVSQLSPLQPKNVRGNTSPLLTGDRGPQTDFNIRLLPKGATSLFAGVNDAGSGTSTANFMLIGRRGSFQYGGGMEYSRLGVTTSFSGSLAGVEFRAYDLRHPTLDAYGNLFVAPKLQLFGGERDITHPDRRTVFGLQFEI
jgi:ABC-type transporter Mla subunit MlaD